MRDAYGMNGTILWLGIIVLIAGVFLVFYSVADYQTVYGVTLITRIDYPYRTYGFVAIFFGVVGLFMGLVMPKKSEFE